MANVTIINEKPITMAEVKEELSKIQNQAGELNFRANKTLEYLNEFSRLSQQKIQELNDKITALDVPRLKEEHMVKIIDTLPRYPDEVKMLLSGYTITLSQENLKKIAATVNEFCS